MKKIISLFTLFFVQILLVAQTGASITGLVKINNIQQSNTNRILLTDGNGNLGQTTFANLANVGTVVTTTLNTAVVKTQIAQNAKFLNLPDANYNRVVTIDGNGSLGYRTFASLANSATNLTGVLGLNATNLINLTGNILIAPSSYNYVVVCDANGVLGKRLLTEFPVKDPNSPCTGWVTTNQGPWGPWYGSPACFSDRTLTQQRNCYAINGNPLLETQYVTETRSDGCKPDPSIPCYWTTTSYGPWICDPANVNNKRRIKNESLICTNYNGTTFVSQTQSVNYEISTNGNQAPVANFTWSANYRTVTLNAASSSDPDGSISSMTVDWGDGAIDTYYSGYNNLQHTYANSNPSQPVVKNVTITVTDDCGRSTVSNSQQIMTTSITKYITYEAQHAVYGYDNSGTTTGDSNFLGSMDVYRSGNYVYLVGKFTLFEPGSEGGYGNHQTSFHEYPTPLNVISSQYSSNILRPGGTGYCSQADILTSVLALPANTTGVNIYSYYYTWYHQWSGTALSSYASNLQFYGQTPAYGGTPYVDECMVPQGFSFDLDAPQILAGTLNLTIVQNKLIDITYLEY